MYAPQTPSHTDPLGLIVSRSAWTLPLFLLLALTTSPWKLPKPTRSELGFFLLAGFCYGPATTAMYALGIGHTSAAHAVLLLSLSPPIAAILAAIVLHERVDALRIAAIVVGAVGGALLTLSRSASGSTPEGDGMILVMATMWGFMVLSMRILNRKYPAILVAGVMGAIGSLILVAIGAALGRIDDVRLPLQYHDIRTLVWFDLELVVFLSIVAQIFQSISLRILGITPVAAITAYGSIFVGLLAAFLILGEHMSTWGILAGSLLLVSLALALVPIRANGVDLGRRHSTYG